MQKYQGSGGSVPLKNPITTNPITKADVLRAALPALEKVVFDTGFALAEVDKQRVARVDFVDTLVDPGQGLLISITNRISGNRIDQADFPFNVYIPRTVDVLGVDWAYGAGFRYLVYGAVQGRSEQAIPPTVDLSVLTKAIERYIACWK